MAVFGERWGLKTVRLGGYPLRLVLASPGPLPTIARQSAGTSPAPAWRLFGIAGMGVSRRSTPSTNKSDRLRGPQAGGRRQPLLTDPGRVKSSELLAS